MDAIQDLNNQFTTLDDVLRLKPGVTVVLLSSERCAVFDGESEHLFNGELFFAVCKSAASPVRVGELAGRFFSSRIAQVFYVVDILARLRILVRPSAEGECEWGKRDQNILDNSYTFLVRGEWPHSIGCMIRELLGHYAQFKSTNTVRHSKTVMLCFARSYIAPRMRQLEQEATTTGVSWIPFRFAGPIIWYGPLINPDSDTWEALHTRVSETHPIEAWAYAKPKSIIENPFLDPGSQIQLLECVVRVIRNLNQNDSHELSSLHAVNSQTSTRTIHSLTSLRFPGRPIARSSNGMVEGFGTGRTRRTLSASGGTRSLTEDAVLEEMQTVFSPITGIIKSIKEVKTEPYKYVFHGRAIVPRSTACKALDTPLEIDSAGKGLAYKQARASCMGEAIERYSTVFRGDENLVDAVGHTAVRKIGITELAHYSELQYSNRNRWNDKYRGMFHVCKKPKEDSVQKWVKAWSFTSRAEVLVPAMYCYFYYPHRDGISLDFRADSNGCASGVSFAEAALQGIYELVERDAVALWWYRRMRRGRAVLIGRARELYEQARFHYSRVGRNLDLLDITSDIGIPVYCAVSHRDDGKGIGLGLGCHVDPLTAAERAVSELHQFLATLESNDAVEQVRPTARFAQAWFREQSIADHVHLNPDGICIETARKIPSLSPWLEDEIKLSISTLRKSNVEVFAVDLSRPECPLRTVRILSPQLRHFWPRFGPGRLYDATWELSHPVAKIGESDLNPTPFFL
ncbi:YcaO-like family protein [Caballeronia arationis]|uniref:YcaO-like family protein n=1 Tax=Caballeronia arationis TaxID=1777142 RepID=UPI00074C6CED|nr:YcaO-like family protein [Caballeronia arationis]SAL06945.1 YcaO-like family protein [Caballeronia arationis]